MIEQFLGELIGTFIFVLIILVVGEPIAIAVGLLAVIYAFGKLSGGHVNPVISTVKYAKGELNTYSYILHIAGQFIGGLCALAWQIYMVDKKI